MGGPVGKIDLGSADDMLDSDGAAGVPPLGAVDEFGSETAAGSGELEGDDESGSEVGAPLGLEVDNDKSEVESGSKFGWETLAASGRPEYTTASPHRVACSP